jgi:hypothetical protein
MWWGVQIIKFLVMCSSPLPCYPVPLMAKYLPQYPIFKHPQPMFLSLHDKPSFTPIRKNRHGYTVVLYTTVFISLQICRYSNKAFLFSKTFTSAVGPTQTPVQCYRIKRSEHDVLRPAPSSARWKVGGDTKLPILCAFLFKDRNSFEPIWPERFISSSMHYWYQIPLKYLKLSHFLVTCVLWLCAALYTNHGHADVLPFSAEC